MSDASPIEVLAEAAPAAAEAFGQLRRAVGKELHPATHELVVIGSLAAKGQLDSLAVHARRALRDGVGVEQLRGAVVATLAASALFGEVVAALRTIDKVAAATAPGVASDAAEDSGAPPTSWPAPAAPAREIDGPLSATLFAPEHSSAVVFLHSLALDRRIWFPLVDALATRLAVLVCDLPGHGRSPAAPEPSVEAMADQVAAVMATAKLPPATVAGLSLGGSVAQALAINHPDRVGALVLMDTTACYGPDGADSWAQRADQARRAGMASLSEFQLDRWFSDDFRRLRPDLCSAVLEIFRGSDVEGYAGACAALGTMDLRPGLATISCPTVVIVGEHDQATPPAHAEQLHRAIAGSTLHVLAGCKHLSAVERPAAVMGLSADLLGV